MAKDKELQKSNFPKTDVLLQDCVDRLGTDWPKIIGQGANIIFDKYNSDLFEKIVPTINDKAVFLEFEITGSIEGKFHIMFPFRDATIIAGSVLMEEEDDIKKNFSVPEMSEDYQDAFNEFGNQTSSSFETIFRNHFPEDDDMHVRFTKSFFPPVDKEKVLEMFKAAMDDEVFITSTQCSIMTFDKGPIDIMLTVDVGESIFNEILSYSTKKAFAHILYVEDVKKDISYVKKMLRNSGYFAHVCNDGDAAISKLQHEKMDMVVISVELAEGTDEDDGLQLCVRIKRNMLLDTIPVVMCSGNATKKTVLDCVRLGASDFMVKPFNKDLFFAKLSKHVKSKRLSK